VAAAKLLRYSLLATVAATLLGVSCAANQIDDKAWTLMNEGRQDIALTMLNQAIRHDKKASLYATRGCCYEQMGKFDLAIADLDQAEKLDPKDMNIRSHRSYCCIQTKQWRKAIADLDAVIASGNDTAYINRALAYEQLGDHSYSIKDKAKIQNAKMKVAIKEALRLETKADFRGSEKKFAEAIAANPTAKTGYFERGAMRLHRSELPEAIADFSQIITMSGGTDAEAYCERAQAYLMLNRYDECIVDANKAIKLGNILAYKKRSQAYLALGDTKRCIDDLTAAIALASKHADAQAQARLRSRLPSMESGDFLTGCYKARALIYEHLNQRKQAMSDYARAAELDPMSFSTTWAQAQYLDKIGEIEAAAKAYGLLIERFPKMPEPYRRRADDLVKTGHPDKAVPDYTKAIELMDIDAGPSYAGRAQAYDKLGKADLAKSDRAMAKKLGFGK
jgi:tetratricopeptide (TPR) repeat protein